jgi:transposase-like protein
VRPLALSHEQRAQLYAEYLTGAFTVRQLAKNYGVAEQTANNIISAQLPAKARVSKPEKMKYDPLPVSKYRIKGGREDQSKIDKPKGLAKAPGLNTMIRTIKNINNTES